MACTVIQIGGLLFFGGGGGTVSSCKINKICEIVFSIDTTWCFNTGHVPSDCPYRGMLVTLKYAGNIRLIALHSYV